MPSAWLTNLAWATLAIAFVSCAIVLFDLFVRRYRQPMAVMQWVWPVTALYFGPFAVWGYLRYGRPRSDKWLAEHSREEPPDAPRWATVAMGVSHCGAGCTLGDIVAEWSIFGIGITLAGEAVYAEFIGDYLLAIALGLAFQYYAIAPMRGLGLRDGLVAAAKADLLSLTAFEVGLFGWMALQAFVFFPAPHHVHPDMAVFWMNMQVGMIVGFATAYPVNAWLIDKGIKEAM